MPILTISDHTHNHDRKKYYIREVLNIKKNESSNAIKSRLAEFPLEPALALTAARTGFGVIRSLAQMPPVTHSRSLLSTNWSSSAGISKDVSRSRRCHWLSDWLVIPRSSLALLLLHLLLLLLELVDRTVHRAGVGAIVRLRVAS